MSDYFLSPSTWLHGKIPTGPLGKDGNVNNNIVFHQGPLLKGPISVLFKGSGSVNWLKSGN